MSEKWMYKSLKNFDEIFDISKTFQNSYDLHDECKYHDGFPIFHDGSKYWSCCKIKCSDFNEFLRQRGCCIGLHDFISIVKVLVNYF